MLFLKQITKNPSMSMSRFSYIINEEKKGNKKKTDTHKWTTPNFSHRKKKNTIQIS